MTGDPVQRRLRDALYSEAMLLADEARGYFDEVGRRETAALDPLARVLFSCESLKVTTRIMHVVAWLLTQRAVDAGEIAPVTARLPAHRLGDAPESDGADALPERARALIEASVDLHRRVQRLDQAFSEAVDSPARAMQERLSRALGA
ncbi:DUF1465 family protein [Sphingomonas lenta]|uniref:Regulator of CtrA degradation rcdA n=1 Tax=Sphingomonas lenta TaxID=1141887 RepID=A0A2A2SKN5_9SPHN|nr:DUF1465 family protein [Sphingomonas lenta]PAX09789.1 hypothetical protein CKY28_01895 [Sphingomonas lenta]